MLRDRDIKEAQSEFVLGGGAEFVYNKGFKAIVNDVKYQLLNQEDLEETQRRSYVLLLRHIKQAFETIYDEAKAYKPEWLEKITT